MTITLADLDSLAYAAGSKATWQDCCAHIQTTILNIKLATRAEKLHCFLEHWGGKFNFRNHVAVSKPYKGNRADKEKPEYLEAAKKYIAENFPTTVCRNFEADDVVIIVATELGYDNVVIAAIDKDLRQIPAKFYDYRKEEHITVTERQASYNFAKQMLMGDSCDNIPGIPGVGEKGADKLLATSEDYLMTVVETYKSKNLPYSYLTEQGRLLYLLRTRREVWRPPVTIAQYNEMEKVTT